MTALLEYFLNLDSPPTYGKGKIKPPCNTVFIISFLANGFNKNTFLLATSNVYQEPNSKYEFYGFVCIMMFDKKKWPGFGYLIQK